jgi:pimeloyl-ACP methyl ester carboxylesterase
MPVLQDARVFASAFTVYNYDRRGRGDSGDTPPYAIEREVEDIEAMIDAAGGTAYLYGHSSGAVLALEAAMRLQRKVKKVVVHDAAYVHDAAEKSTYGALSEKVRGLLKDGKNGAAMRSFLGGIGMPKAFVLLLPLIPGWKTMKALAPTLAYDIALTRDMPPLERVAQITVPSQIIVGEKTAAGMRAVANQLAQTIPDAQYVQLAGQNHMASAKVVLPVMVSFLK